MIEKDAGFQTQCQSSMFRTASFTACSSSESDDLCAEDEATGDEKETDTSLSDDRTIAAPMHETL